MEFNFSEVKQYKGQPSEKFFKNYPYTGHHYTVTTIKKIPGKPDVESKRTAEVIMLDLPEGAIAPGNLKEGKRTKFARGPELGFRPYATPHSKKGCKEVKIHCFLDGDREKMHYFDVKEWYAFLGTGKYEICPDPPFVNPRTKQNRANMIKSMASKFAGDDDFSKGAKWETEVGK